MTSIWYDVGGGDLQDNFAITMATGVGYKYGTMMGYGVLLYQVILSPIAVLSRTEYFRFLRFHVHESLDCSVHVPHD